MTHQAKDPDELDCDVIVLYDERLAQSADLVDFSAPRLSAAQCSQRNPIESPDGRESSSCDRNASGDSTIGNTSSYRIRRILHCLDLLELDRRRMSRNKSATDAVAVHNGSDPAQHGELRDNRILSDSYASVALLPEQIARFRIVRKLGSGGFGIVFLAEDPVLRRKVAVKIPRPEALLTPDLQRRFIQESQLAARLRHPGVVSIYEAGRDGTISFQVTEYCSGGTLAEFLRASECDEAGAASTVDCELYDENRSAASAASCFLSASSDHATSRSTHQRQLPFDVAAELLIGIAEGVQHAHEQGILHRDLKPANILLQPRSESQQEDRQSSANSSTESLCRHYFARVSDFGLAILLEGLSQDDGASSSLPGNRPAETMIAGTPRYMAPEQMTPRGAAERKHSDRSTAEVAMNSRADTSAASSTNPHNNSHDRLVPVKHSAPEIGPATDVYGLGAILYEVLCGVPVFQQSEPGALRHAVLHEKPQPIRNYRPDIPRDLESICLKALSKISSDRYSTAGQMADDLRSFRRGAPVVARPWTITERLINGYRQYPAIAGLLTIVAVLSLGLIAFGFWHVRQLSTANEKLGQSIVELRIQKAIADRSSELATSQSRIASEQKRLAEEQRESAERYSQLAREREYSAAMLHASDLFRHGSMSQLSAVLQPFIPSEQATANRSDSAPDRRGFEWHYLWNQSRSELDLIGQSSNSRETIVTPDGAQCLSVTTEGRVFRWELRHGQMLHSFPTSGAGQRREFKFSADSRRLLDVCMSNDPCWHEVSVWDTQNGQLLYHRKRDEVQGSRSTITPDGAVVIFNGLIRTPEHDGEVILEAIDVGTGRTTPIAVEDMVTGSRPIWIYEMAVSPSSQHLLVHAHFPAGSRILSTPMAPVVESLRRPADAEAERTVWTAVTDFQEGVGLQFACSPDETTLAIGNRDPNLVRIVDMATGRCERTMEELPDWGYCFSFEGNDRLAVRHYADRAQLPRPPDSSAVGTTSVLTIWNLDSDQRTTTEADISTLAWHEPTGTRLVGRAGGQLTAIRDRQAEPYKVLSGHRPSESWGVAFSCNGQRLYSVGDDASLKVWDMESGTLLASQNEHESLVSSLAVSPDGRWIATGSYDDTVVLWDANSTTMKHRLTGHTHDLRTLAFSPDGRCLASAGRCSEIKLWDVENGTLINSIPRHGAVVRCLAFLSPTSFVEANADGFVVCHDLPQKPVGGFSNRVLATLPQEIHSLAVLSRNVEQDMFPALTSGVSGLISFPERQNLIAGGKFGMVNVLPVSTVSSSSPSVNRNETMQLLQRFHGVDIRSIAVAPDGRSVAISGDDRVIHIVSLQTGQELLSLADLPAPVNQLAFSPHGEHMAAALHNGDIRIWSTTSSWREADVPD